MSDHLYIVFEYKQMGGLGDRNATNENAWYKRYPRWKIKEMDVELFSEALDYTAGAYASGMVTRGKGTRNKQDRF